VVKPCINRAIERPPAELCAELATYGVATVHEAQGRQGLLAANVRPIREGWSICGPAITSLNHPGDNLMVHAAIDLCQPGDVLVVASTAPAPCGVIGDLLARQAHKRRVAGLVVDIGVRDVADLRRMGMPVWTSAITAAGAVKSTPGWVNVPMVCAGAVVRPGDLIVADDDGVVVVPREDAPWVAKAAAERVAREARTRERYDAGESSMDINNLREYLRAHGVE
jgi:4-hydroxy-4-methyl-2-oxoglutarate aldolase